MSDAAVPSQALALLKSKLRLRQKSLPAAATADPLLATRSRPATDDSHSAVALFAQRTAQLPRASHASVSAAPTARHHHLPALPAAARPAPGPPATAAPAPAHVPAPAPAPASRFRAPPAIPVRARQPLRTHAAARLSEADADPNPDPNSPPDEATDAPSDSVSVRVEFDNPPPRRPPPRPRPRNAPVPVPVPAAEAEADVNTTADGGDWSTAEPHDAAATAPTVRLGARAAARLQARRTAARPAALATAAVDRNEDEEQGGADETEPSLPSAVISAGAVLSLPLFLLF